MENNQIVLGKRSSGAAYESDVVLDEMSRRRHLCIFGASGVGKSTLLFNLIAQDIYAGHGICAVDPHGDLSQSIIDIIPPQRMDQVCYIDASDLSWSVSFNPLETVHRDDIATNAAGVVAAIRHVFDQSWGPRLEHVLTNSVACLIEYPGGSLLGLPRLLMDGNYRQHVLRSVQDPVVLAFWKGEYERYDNRFLMEAISPILNKIGSYLANPALRFIFAMPKSKLRMEDVLAKNKIVIANLARGSIGDTPSRLLGALLISQLHTAAMRRSKIPEKFRRSFFLYIDEAATFATPALPDILESGRKFALPMTAAMQHLHQAPPDFRASLIGNVANWTIFKCGLEDSEHFARQFSIKADELSGCLPYKSWMHLDGWQQALPVDMLPPLKFPAGQADKVKWKSARNYGRSRRSIERYIKRFMSGYANG